MLFVLIVVLVVSINCNFYCYSNVQVIGLIVSVSAGRFLILKKINYNSIYLKIEQQSVQ